MMKVIKFFLVILFSMVLAFVAYRNFFMEKKVFHKTISIENRNIIDKIDVPGNVYPEREIEIKSQLSGILDKVQVNIGDKVDIGTPIASIKMIPNAVEIERLESSVKTTKIEYSALKADYNREKQLYEKGVIAKVEIDRYEKAYRIAKERFETAKKQLSIVKLGRVSQKKSSNVVRSSSTGTVIDIPIEKGASVIERNNFNKGTTIAVIAKTSIFRFKALLSEEYLSHLNQGDTILLSFNAYKNLKVKAVVNQISSKGQIENGIVKYIFSANFSISPNMPIIRSGYSAIANIILDKKLDVPAIEEKYVLYEKDSTYVYVLDSLSRKGKKNIKIGLSDGTYAEIVEGLSLEDEIIVDSVIE